MTSSAASKPRKGSAVHRRRPASSPREIREDLRPDENDQIPVPLDQSVAHFVAQSVAFAPSQTALTAGDKSWTYEELWARSGLVASGLLQMRQNDAPFVALCLPRGPELISAMLGVWRAGLGFVPIDPSYPGERIRFMAEDSRAEMIVAANEDAHRFEGLNGKTVAFDELLQAASPSHTPLLPTPDFLAYMIYTSGSSGKPKGVPITHANLLRHNLWFGREVALRRGRNVLHFCSPSFDAAIEEIFPTLAFGATLVVRDDSLLDPVELVSFMRHQQVQVMNVPTAYWHTFVRRIERDEVSLPDCIDTCIIGGERANRDVVRRWLRIAPKVRLLNMYGPTETTITATRYDLGDYEINDDLPIGRPVAGLRADILDAKLRPVAKGERGELCLSGPGLSPGYWFQPDVTAERFATVMLDGASTRIYRTGDIAYENHHSELMFCGRLDEQVKVRGHRIDPGEIENALLQVSGVSQAMVVPDAGSDTRDSIDLLAAYTGEPLESDVRSNLTQHLPPYMMPARIVRLRSLPTLPNGKLDRKGLASLVAQGKTTSPPRAQEDPAPTVATNLTQLALLDICRQVIGRAELQVSDHFFEVGGHSLHSVEVIERANRTGLPLEPQDFFRNATIAGLADACDKRISSTAHRDNFLCLQPRGDRAPVVFFHSLPGDLLGYGALIHHMGSARPCFGFQSQGLNGQEKLPQMIERQAAGYLNRIRAEFPTGALHLVGWCFGGHLALEAVRLLRSEGRTDVSLCMLEGFPVLPPFEHHLRRARTLCSMSWREKAAFVRARTAGLHREALDPTAEFALDTTAGAFAHRKAVHAANDVAYGRYRTRPIDTEMLLVRGRKKAGRLLTHDYGWSEYVRDLRAVEVDGDHQSLLKDPHVREVALILKRWFGRHESRRLR